MVASDTTPPPVLVLTAGLGTRLRPLTRVRAKAAIPVNGEPLVRRIIAWLAREGAHDLVLNLHHLPDSITRVVGDGSDLGVRVRYSWEETVLGSAGGPRRALPLMSERDDNTFLLVNGDTLTNVSIPALLQAHAASGALVTMALIPNPRPDKYGGVELSSSGHVTGFTRPGAATAHSHHFIGVQAVQAQTFMHLADGVPCSSVGGVYSALMTQGPGAIAGFVCNAAFTDIGTPADCLATSLQLAAEEGDRMTAAVRSIPPSATVLRTALWNDVTVGEGSRLTDCIVADGVRIPDGATFERCAIVPAAGQMPEDGERLEGALVVRPF